MRAVSAVIDGIGSFSCASVVSCHCILRHPIAIKALFKMFYRTLRRMVSDRFAQEFVQFGIFHALDPAVEAFG